MSDETVVPFSGTFKTIEERHAEELHDFLIHYIKMTTHGKNFCSACGGGKWRPHSHIFPTYLVRSSGLVHLEPLPFLLVSCDKCGNTLFFAITSELRAKHADFEKDFKERQLPKEGIE